MSPCVWLKYEGALVVAKRNAQALCSKYVCMRLYCLFRQQLEEQKLQTEDKLPCNSFSLLWKVEKGQRPTRSNISAVIQ